MNKALLGLQRAANRSEYKGLHPMLILAAAALLEKFPAAEKSSGAPVIAGPPSSLRVAAVTCGSSPQTPEETCLPVEATWGGNLCFVFSRLWCDI